MAVTGAIIGDIMGSLFEFDQCENYEGTELLTENCMFTDDTVMTLAIKKALLEGKDMVKTVREVGQKHPLCGYGGKFEEWMFSENPKPYGSFGNGSAMRVSFVGEYYEDLEEVKKMAEKTAEFSHNHPEGIKGAVVTAVCIWMAKHGKTKQEIYDYVLEMYPAEKYEWNITVPLSKLQKDYKWDVTCQGSVPVAMRCFFESDSYISFIRNVISFYCDSDTLCCIGGGVAEEYYHSTGFDDELIMTGFLTDDLYEIYKL